MINLDDENFSSEARLYFRDLISNTQDDIKETNQFTARVNAINAILEDNCNKLKQAVADSGLSAAHEFQVLQFTVIPFNRFARIEPCLKAAKPTTLLEVATKENAKKCVEYLKQNKPKKKKRNLFRRK